MTGADIINSGHTIGLGPHQLVLHQMGELQVLLLLELLLLVKECVDVAPQLAVGGPPAAAGDEELVVPAWLDVVHVAVVALECGLLAGLQIEHLDISHVGSSIQKLLVT